MDRHVNYAMKVAIHSKMFQVVVVQAYVLNVHQAPLPHQKVWHLVNYAKLVTLPMVAFSLPMLLS
jgi:hypothetical protein